MDPFTILIDTREPIRKAYSWEDIPTKRVHLPEGDYSAAGLLGVVAVERKTIEDFASSIQQRRFWRELHRVRAGAYRSFVLVVEATLSEIRGGKWRGGVSVAAVMGALHAIPAKYGIPVVLTGNRAASAAFTFGHLDHWSKLIHKEKSMGQNSAIQKPPKGDPVEVAGEVIRVLFSSTDASYTIGVLVDAADNKHTFTLRGGCQKGDRLVLKGHKTTHPKFGEQINAITAAFDLPLSEDGIVAYVAEHPSFRGLGPVRARALVRVIGAEGFTAKVQTLRIQAGGQQAVADMAKIPLPVVVSFFETWTFRSQLNAAFSTLSALDLSQNQIERLVALYGARAAETVRARPYTLQAEVEGFGFKTSDTIALKLGWSKGDPRRIEAGVQEVLRVASEEGHTWLPQEEAYSAALRLLEVDSKAHQGVIRAIVEGTNGALVTKRTTRPIFDFCWGDVAGVQSISLERLHRAEARIYLFTALERPRENPYFFQPGPFQFIDLDLLGKYSEGLTEGQQAALSEAMGRKAILISGGAGTGKTTLIKRIAGVYADRYAKELELHCFQGPNLPPSDVDCWPPRPSGGVLLLAPTGKAAKRVSEATGLPASTIHRALDYDGKTFSIGRLSARVVIVDEASMVDAELLSTLLDALSEGAALILVGDHNQLPPVGPGSPLRDLLAKNYLHGVVLRDVVRQAGILRENCLTILEGRVAPTCKLDPTTGAANPWTVLSRDKSPEETAADLSALFASHLCRLGFDLLRETQVLTAQRGGPLGVDALNKELQRLNQLSLGREIPPIPEGKRPLFYPQDKVIYTRNNYDLDPPLYNGTPGIVVQTTPELPGIKADPEDKGILILWEGEQAPRILPERYLKEISLAYALTVHRAQGSEYPLVVVVVHKAHAFLHRGTGRSWLYTAATRGKKAVVLIGDPWGISQAAAVEGASLRRTFLSAWNPLPSTSALKTEEPLG